MTYMPTSPILRKTAYHLLGKKRPVRESRVGRLYDIAARRGIKRKIKDRSLGDWCGKNNVINFLIRSKMKRLRRDTNRLIRPAWTVKNSQMDLPGRVRDTIRRPA